MPKYFIGGENQATIERLCAGETVIVKGKGNSMKTEGTQGSLSLDMLKGIISYAKSTISNHPKYLTKWDEMQWEVEQYEQLYEE